MLITRSFPIGNAKGNYRYSLLFHGYMSVLKVVRVLGSFLWNQEATYLEWYIYVHKELGMYIDTIIYLFTN
jgi:hypothetical protein